MRLLVRSLVMAAWLVVTGMLGVVVGLGVGWLLGDGTRRELDIERRKIEFIPPRRNEDGELMSRVLDRLLGAVIPEPQSQAPDEVETRSDAEYVPPEDDWRGGMDWTDPLLGGIERPLVGRLAPGQGIPGIPVQDGQVDPVEMWREKGESAFDEWARETIVPEGDELEAQWNAWVDPVEDV